MPNTTILSSAVNQNYTDIASGLSDCLTRDGQAGMTAAFKAISGSAGAPSITFTSDITSGLYLIGAGILGLTANGVLGLTINASQVGIWSQSAAAKNFVVLDTTDASTSNNINTLATAGVGAIQIGTSTSWATNGYLLVGNEIMSYTVASANGLTINTRGDMGTSAISHATGSTITQLFSGISKANWVLPYRATASRATSPSPGNFAFNTGSAQPEYYNGTAWVGVAPNNLVPQGYLSPTAGTPIVTSDALSQTNIFYNPYSGNLIPVPVNGVFTVQTFSTATIALSASQTTANVYDIYGFISSTNSTLTFGISPSWAAGSGGSVTPGSCARGTGAGGTQITQVGGFWTNTTTMTILNGASSYSIATASGILLGSIFIGATAGTVNLHRGYGQNRQWGIDNVFNRVPIYARTGDSTASWTSTAAGYRPSNNATANKFTVLQSLAEETIISRFMQLANCAAGNATLNLGIGVNATTTANGYTPTFTQPAGLGGTNFVIPHAEYASTPILGLAEVTSLEKSSATATYFGAEINMLLVGTWRG